MKRRGVLLIFLLMTLSLLVFVSPQEVCTDSDGGSNYFIKGDTYGRIYLNQTTTTFVTKEDICNDDYELNEYVCSNDELLLGILYDCPNGCTDGACIEEPNTEPCEILATISTGVESNKYTISGKQYAIGVHMWSGSDALIKIDGEIIKNRLGKGDSLKTDELTIKVTDYKYYDYIKLCLNDASVACPDCQKLVEEVTEPRDDCFDSDFSLGYPAAYFKKGYADSDNWDVKIEDMCGADENVLLEASCYTDGLAYKKEYSCPNGCKDGACIQLQDDEQEQFKTGENEQENLGGENLPTNETEICPGQCVFNDSCVSVGYRFNETFCNFEGNFVEQRKKEGLCENNFECISNLCINSECVSGSLWAKFIRWLGRLF